MIIPSRELQSRNPSWPTLALTKAAETFNSGTTQIWHSCNIQQDETDIMFIYISTAAIHFVVRIQRSVLYTIPYNNFCSKAFQQNSCMVPPTPFVQYYIFSTSKIKWMTKGKVWCDSIAQVWCQFLLFFFPWAAIYSTAKLPMIWKIRKTSLATDRMKSPDRQTETQLPTTKSTLHTIPWRGG